jgi:hypothetical protein
MSVINLYDLPLPNFRGAHLSPEGFGDQIAGVGFTGNGVSKKLSQYFSTLSAAQAAFPLVSGIDLTDQLDYAANTQLINQMVSASPTGTHPQIGGLVELHHKGNYLINKRLALGSGINLQGGGRQTVLFRAGVIPTGAGFIEIPAGSVGVSIQDLLIEGNVTTPVGLTYDQIGGDPFSGLLTPNTSLWIHSLAGVETTDIEIKNVTFQHTGGYACIIDARFGNIKRVKFTRCTFINCRPHFFGATTDDMNYGSWTGGVFYANDGTNDYCASDITFENCKMTRCNGNGIWGHSTTLTTHNRNVNILNCVFEDMALSATQMGNVTGGSVQNCTFHRVGYITRTDAATPQVAWLAGAPAVCIDTSGYASNITYSNNTARSVNGEFIDGDGLQNSSILNNTGSIPLNTDSDYLTDSVRLYGPGASGTNSSRGINPGNTQKNGGSTYLTISGNHLHNFGGCAMALNYLRFSTVTDNDISHPSDAAEPPVEMYSDSTAGDEFYNHDNKVADNRIQYGGLNWCIAEVGAGWAPSDVNLYVRNVCDGPNKGEIKTDPNSGSIAAHVFSTADPAALFASESMLQREGSGNTASFKIYSRISSNTGPGGSIVKTLTQKFAISDVGPVINVSNNGLTNTGAFTTGNIISLGFYDSMVTKRFLSVGGYIAFEDTGAYDFTADSLDPPSSSPGSWGLIRYNKPASALQTSVATNASGQRIWVTIGSGGGSALPAGLDTWIQYNRGGAFGADSNIIWDYTLQRQTVTGKAGTAAIFVASGFVQAHDGFYTTDTDGNSIQTLGGVFARGYTIVNTAQTRQYGWTVDSIGNLTLTDNSASAVRTTLNTSGTLAIGVPGSGIGTSIDQAGNLSSTNNITGKNLGLSDLLILTSHAAPPAVPSAGQLALYAGPSNLFYWNSTAWIALTGGGSGTQTPWLSNIDGAGYSLINAPYIGMGTTIGPKLAAFDGGVNNFYGLGIQGGLLQLIAPTPATGIVMGFGLSASLAGKMIVTPSGVGIGYGTPSNHLEVGMGVLGASLPGVHLTVSNNTGNSVVDVGQSNTNRGRFYWSYNATAASAYMAVETQGGANPLVLQSQGNNVGIGVTTPTSPLSFSGTAGSKINLFDVSGYNYGFGIGSASLQMYVPDANNVVAIGYGTSASLVEVLVVKGNSVGIGTRNPTGRLTIQELTVPSTVAACNQIVINEPSTAAGYYFNVGYGAFATSWCGVLQVGNGGGAGNLLLNPGGGPVGIGVVTTPQITLEVANPGNAYNAYFSGVAPSLMFGPTLGILPTASSNPAFAFFGFATLNGHYGASVGDLVIATASWQAGNSNAIKFAVPANDSSATSVCMSIVRGGYVTITGNLTVTGALTVGSFAVSGVYSASSFNATIAISNTNVAFQAGNGAIQIMSSGKINTSDAIVSTGSITGNSYLAGAYTIVDVSQNIYAKSYWLIGGSGPIVAADGSWKGNVNTAGFVTATSFTGGGGFSVNSAGALSTGGVIATQGGVNVTVLLANNSIQTSGGINSSKGYFLNGNTLIDVNGAFFGSGIVTSGGVQAGSLRITNVAGFQPTIVIAGPFNVPPNYGKWIEVHDGGTGALVGLIPLF